MSGSKPIIVDVDKIDFNVTYEEIKIKINDKTKAIIVPHTFGVPADVISLKKLGIPIIEDCAQSLGSKINNIHTGQFGDLAIFSFYASKMITTGEGGMLVSKNSEYIEKARDYREFDGRKIYYPRFNFQMTDIQAAMGIVQLNKLDNFLEKRRAIAENYINTCQEKDWDYQKARNNCSFQNWYRFVLKADPGLIIKIKEALFKSGIKCIVPIEDWELLSTYLKMDSNSFKISKELAVSTLSLPIYPDLLKDKNFKKILEILRGS